ncbi:1d68b600-8eea-47c3-bd4d-e559bbb6be30 [Sclerotinia trifoliorum]|uniref:1d68b600-8eea-47c3-bd4d-e559bbb6be30 n=1 Tax=Sclerotinia trifoliorum TaxID=28548 RepID=A0A8H2W287_9HELO|nr:1d68b600-8eea-47c3-bd4d-e559bbb6be30 [Sclerotinia trifoliorum]
MAPSRRRLDRSSVFEDNINTTSNSTSSSYYTRSLTADDVTLGSIATLARIPVDQATPKVRCLKTNKLMNSGAFNHPVVILCISQDGDKEVSALCCQISGNSNPFASEASSFLPISTVSLGGQYSRVPVVRNEAVLEDKAMFKRCYILTGHGSSPPCTQLFIQHIMKLNFTFLQHSALPPFEMGTSEIKLLNTSVLHLFQYLIEVARAS